MGMVVHSHCLWCSTGTETLAAGGPASFQNAADFYSKEEAAAFAKPKKRLRKKLRKKAGVKPMLHSRLLTVGGPQQLIRCWGSCTHGCSLSANAIPNRTHVR